jgi:hypothetical protein
LSEADVAHVARTLADALTHVARGG